MEPDAVQPSPRVAPPTPRSGVPRKAIALPRTLPELQQQAALHLGIEGHMRFYHKDTEIHTARKLEDVLHEDVITVRGARRRDDGGPATCSTHQADFVPHPLKTPEPPLGDDSVSTLSEQAKLGKMVDCNSCYRGDFIKHPVQRGPFVTGKDAFKTNIPRLDTSSYYKTSNLDHYPWRSVDDKSKGAADILEDSRMSVLTQATKGKPFQGRSCYNADYDTRYRGRPEPAVAVITDSTSTLTEAVRASNFVGKSSYGDHFVKHPLDGRQPSARPARGLQHTSPFDGQSEYNQKYGSTPISSHRAGAQHCILERSDD